VIKSSLRSTVGWLDPQNETCYDSLNICSNKAVIVTEIKIRTVGASGHFEDVISGASPKLQEIAHALRALLADVMPNITEVAWGQQKIAGYGVGPKKLSEQFCYIAPQKNYVNLGFYYGADLPDPEGLLEGSGKELRHIKIHTLEQVKQPAVRKLVEEASRHLPRLEA
jgi:hypothetical protein